MATRIATAINARFANAAKVEDPGSIALTPPADSAGGGRAVFLAQVAELTVTRQVRARIIIDGRDGTVAAGGDLPVGNAVVSYGSLTLAIGGAGAPAANGAAAAQPDGGPPAGPPPVPGQVRVAQGTTVQDVAAALHAVAAPAKAIASIFASLREVGALTAEVQVR
jgi:flagellar P-ring protein precursor FlgI